MTAFQALRVLRQIRADTRGASAVEYGLIIAVVMLAIFAGVAQLGGSLQGLMTYIAEQLQRAIA